MKKCALNYLLITYPELEQISSYDLSDLRHCFRLNLGKPLLCLSRFFNSELNPSVWDEHNVLVWGFRAKPTGCYCSPYLWLSISPKNIRFRPVWRLVRATHDFCMPSDGVHRLPRSGVALINREIQKIRSCLHWETAASYGYQVCISVAPVLRRINVVIDFDTQLAALVGLKTRRIFSRIAGMCLWR